MANDYVEVPDAQIEGILDALAHAMTYIGARSDYEKIEAFKRCRRAYDDLVRLMEGAKA